MVVLDIEVRDAACLLNVVVRKSAAVLKLLAGEDQALLVWGNSLLVCEMKLDLLIFRAHFWRRRRHTLDLGLDIVDGVG
jgi:hypothetical protein